MNPTGVSVWLGWSLSPLNEPLLTSLSFVNELLAD